MSKKVWKTLLITCVIFLIVGLGYLVLKTLGLDDLEKLQKIVNSPWGMIIFILILIAQVIFLPAGTLLFSGSAVVLFGENPLKAWLICWFGLAVGSYLMFAIARIFGIKILKWIVGEQKARKYAYILGRGKFVLPMILLVPIFPDDVVCVAAGLSNLHWLYFVIVITITRGIDNFCTVFIGSELLKTTTGIIFLCCFVVVMIIVAIFLTKYQDKIENWFVNTFTSKKYKEKHARKIKEEEEFKRVEKLTKEKAKT